MSVRLSIFRPDFSRTSVDKLSDGSWTIDLYDENYNCFTIFVDNSESIHLLGAQLITLTKIEKTDPYKVGV